jgi:hypothetical protein
MYFLRCSTFNNHPRAEKSTQIQRKIPKKAIKLIWNSPTATIQWLLQHLGVKQDMRQLNLKAKSAISAFTNEESRNFLTTQASGSSSVSHFTYR